MARTHHFGASVTWTGNRGRGTSSYRSYDRDHTIDNPHKPTIAGSACPAFRGNRTRWNPEELLIISLAQCHLLWYLQVLHDAPNNMCFIARSVNFPVRHRPKTRTEPSVTLP